MSAIESRSLANGFNHQSSAKDVESIENSRRPPFVSPNGSKTQTLAAQGFSKDWFEDVRLTHEAEIVGV